MGMSLQWEPVGREFQAEGTARPNTRGRNMLREWRGCGETLQGWRRGWGGCMGSSRITEGLWAMERGMGFILSIVEAAGWFCVGKFTQSHFSFKSSRAAGGR